MFPIFRFKGIDFKTWFPPNWLSEFVFIDIKMCLMVIGNYCMNFRPGLKRDRTHINSHELAQKPQMKNENPSLSSPYLSKNQNCFWFFSYYICTLFLIRASSRRGASLHASALDVNNARAYSISGLTFILNACNASRTFVRATRPGAHACTRKGSSCTRVRAPMHPASS